MCNIKQGNPEFPKWALINKTKDCWNWEVKDNLK